MEKGFYSWYEDVFNECSALVKDRCEINSVAMNRMAIATLLFSGRFSSPSVVIRMMRPYDFIFSGAWAGSFKAFVYRQQNYNNILYELYADQLHSKLLNEHRDIYSFIEGHLLHERSNVNKALGSRLDQVFKVVLPSSFERDSLIGSDSNLNILSIVKGVFNWPRSFVFVQGDDTFESLVNAGVQIEVIHEQEYNLGAKSVVVKFAELDCCGVRQFVVVMPYFDHLDLIPSQIASLRQEVDMQIKYLESSKMSISFVRPNLAEYIQP